MVSVQRVMSTHHVVGITKQYFRCITCGSDLEQKVNGVISYIPVLTIVKTHRPYVRLNISMAKRKFTNFVPRPNLVNVREDIQKTLINTRKDHTSPTTDRGENNS